MKYPLTPHNYDGVVSALTGNGELCTTVGPTGYHTPPEQATGTAHRTQHFVMAGRRRRGPQHPLVNLGTITREVRVDGQPSEAETWEQDIFARGGRIRSRLQHAHIEERTDSFITLVDNGFMAHTVLTNADAATHEIGVMICYRFGEKDADVQATMDEGGVRLVYRLEDHLGEVHFCGDLTGITGEGTMSARLNGADAVMKAVLSPGKSIMMTTWLHFSDRLHYEFPVSISNLPSRVERSMRAWSDFWLRSEVVTGDETVDDFRKMALYTLRCQMTPWSIGPTLSEPYWDGGAFHDELYPFFGLLSSNFPELAARIPYFRLATLPQAQQRARGRGALYPWSSTEFGEERDPNGLWLTERFHLGQFAACIWHLWLYERDKTQLDDLYPVLRDIARYFEMNLLERDGASRLRTRACVDFDESVGPVTNGPFTLCAAIAGMEYAANAADVLGRDAERAERWRALAEELRQNLPTGAVESRKSKVESGDSCDLQRATCDSDVYAIPDGKPLHYSVVGPVFPFRVDVDSPRAKRTAAYIHEVCRSTKGWKSGFSEAFEGSNWMWTAGHLGIVHALQENAELAWDAVKHGPDSAGPFLSPNEHVNKEGVIQVPWFTTGCGAWLYALNALFVQVDEEGTKLLPAVPSALKNPRFRDLRAENGVLVSGKLCDGCITKLTARAPRPIPWRFRLPARYAEGCRLTGRVVQQAGEWLCVEMDEIGTEDTMLLAANERK